MQRLAVVLLLAGCFAHAHYGMEIRSVVGRVRPACDTVTFRQDETEDWWWWANACGEALWCRRDRHGEMVCGERGTEQPEVDLEATARQVARCPMREIIGQKEIDHAGWLLSLCGRAIDCERIGGAWTCRAH